VDKLKSFYVDHFNFEVTEEINAQRIVSSAGQIEITIHKIGQGYEPADAPNQPRSG